jgi:transposase
VPDRRCRPIARLTSPGQHGDAPRFIPADGLDPHPTPWPGPTTPHPGRCPGRQGLLLPSQPRRRRIRAIIPVKEDQKQHRRNRGRAGGRPPSFDSDRYRQRNTVERCFNKLKAFRAVATRLDKRERIYQGTIDVASIRIWLRDPVT